MSKEISKHAYESEPSISVKVDVAKIVKYLSIAGVFIVAIIFVTHLLGKIFGNCEE